MYDRYFEFNGELEKKTKHLFDVLISGLVLVSISLIVSLTLFCYMMTKQEISKKIGKIEFGLPQTDQIDQATIQIDNKNAILDNSTTEIKKVAEQPIINTKSDMTALENMCKQWGIDSVSKGVENGEIKIFKFLPKDFDKISDLSTLNDIKNYVQPEYLDANKYSFMGVRNYIAYFMVLNSELQ